MEVEMANRVEKGGEIRAGSLHLVVLLGIVLHLPSVGWGFFMDDYVHLGVLTGELQHPQLRSWSLFDFGEVKDFEYRPDLDGGFPWWTDQDWKARFFRPVSSLSVWLDFQMFGEWAPGFHLTNLLLFGLLIRSLYPLYRSWGLGPKAAFMSMLVFACLDDNLTPVGWLANRNSLLATLLIVLAMLLVQRARLESSTWKPAGSFPGLRWSSSRQRKRGSRFPDRRCLSGMGSESLSVLPPSSRLSVGADSRCHLANYLSGRLCVGRIRDPQPVLCNALGFSDALPAAPGHPAGHHLDQLDDALSSGYVELSP